MARGHGRASRSHAFGLMEELPRDPDKLLGYRHNHLITQPSRFTYVKIKPARHGVDMPTHPTRSMAFRVSRVNRHGFSCPL